MSVDTISNLLKYCSTFSMSSSLLSPPSNSDSSFRCLRYELYITAKYSLSAYFFLNKHLLLEDVVLCCLVQVGLVEVSQGVADVVAFCYHRHLL